MHTPRVVVTGLGTVNPIGNSVPEFWKNALAGTSGIGTITRFDATSFYVKCAAEVKNFDPYALMDPKIADRNPRAVHYSLAAAKEAMAQAGIDMSRETPERVGVNVAYMSESGYNVKQAETLARRGPRRVDPLFVARIGASAPAMQIGMVYQLTNQFEEAIEYYNKSLEIAKEIGNRTLEAMTLHRIGMAP